MHRQQRGICDATSPEILSTNLPGYDYDYRGDSRHPIDDHIFAKGFITRDRTKSAVKDDGVAPNPISRICFTHQLRVASLFPLPNQNNAQSESTWIYVLKIPQSEDYSDFGPQLSKLSGDK